MPSTPVHALPYPVPTDPADGPAGFSALATRTELALGGAVGATLPGSPYDGQIARVKVSANGPVWTFVYLAGSAAPYRWHFLGGADLSAEVLATFNHAAATWADTGTVTPAIPWAGLYDATWYTSQNSSIAGGVSIAGLGINAAVPAGGAAAYLLTQTNVYAFALAGGVRLTLPAAAVVRAWLYSANGSAQSNYRRIVVRPVAVQ